MRRMDYVALLAVTVVAFLLSSVYYSPLVSGRRFLELSGFATAPKPSAMKAAFEMMRTFVLAYVIARLVLLLKIDDWKRALRLGLWLWVGFPMVLLTGSMLWQGTPAELAAIHAGDWLIKLTLIPVTVAVWRGRAAAA